MVKFILFCLLFVFALFIAAPEASAIGCGGARTGARVGVRRAPVRRLFARPAARRAARVGYGC